MMGYESITFLAGDGVASGLIPVEPGLAVLVLIGALIASAVCISLAAVPPSALLRRVQLTRPTRNSGAGHRRGTAHASA
jgi:hypothetical protein